MDTDRSTNSDATTSSKNSFLTSQSIESRKELINKYLDKLEKNNYNDTEKDNIINLISTIFNDLIKEATIPGIERTINHVKYLLNKKNIEEFISNFITRVVKSKLLKKNIKIDLISNLIIIINNLVNKQKNGIKKKIIEGIKKDIISKLSKDIKKDIKKDILNTN